MMRAAMTSSSMSNSTTNSLLSSGLTPEQKQQLNATMSVYATIKSNNMMMQLGGGDSNQTASSSLPGKLCTFIICIFLVLY